MVRMLRIAGIDVGTGFTKAVVIGVASADGQTPAAEGAPEILGRASLRTGVEMEKAAREALAAALEAAGQRDAEVRYVAATGFGRHAVSFRDIQITEITSSARGARFLYPHATCVLDIGSQTTRAITLTETGRVNQFKSNDKCAAGSGSFIARATKYLEIPLEQAGEKALDADKPQAISSICAVLAETDVINFVSRGVSAGSILRGIHESMAGRYVRLLKSANAAGTVAVTGGLSRDTGLVAALNRASEEQKLNLKCVAHPDAIMAGAYGAALWGAFRHDALRRKQVA